MSDEEIYAELFERQRPQLEAVAYRMLGSRADAEDAVQETWLRLARADADGVANLAGWLTTVIGRICIDMLRSRRSRQEEYTGSWLPEPVIEAGDFAQPEREAMLSDSVGLALLIVLDALSPAERLAYVLHDMFGVSFEEIGPIVERSPATARQLASRARRRVRGAGPAPEPDPVAQREVVDAFLAASREGDFEGLLEILDPGVVFRIDAGAGSPLSQPPVHGPRAVAREVIARARFTNFGRAATVNGGPGLVLGPLEAPVGVAGITIVDGRITEINVITDPRKLPRRRG